MIVCICNNISDRTIRQAVDAGMTSMPQIREHLGLGTCCGKCHPHAKEVLRKCVSEARQLESQPMIFHPMAA